MSELANSFNDILLDYCEEILKFSGDPNTTDYHVYNPLQDNESYILLDTDASFVSSNYSSVTQVNKNLLSNFGQSALKTEDVYRLMTELSVEDLSFFSPSIEIYRKLPIVETSNTGEALSFKQGGFVYKKMDFVDGYKSFDPTGSNIEQSMFEGKAGTGIAAITQASWEVAGSTDALDGKTELTDMFTKNPTSIPKMEISFAFDSAQTFFGNKPELIADFFINPIANIQKLKDSNIESEDVTRNYAYLMFLNDIKNDSKNENKITPDTNKQAYNFLISIGYKPSNIDFTTIITDKTRQDRLIKFNSFLLNYGQYFNLYFKGGLNLYSFEFGKDNSIKLKCEFIGNVDQGALRDLYSLRRSDMDYMKVLEDIAIKDPNFIATQSSGNIGDITQMAKLSDTIKTLNKYIISCANKEEITTAKECLAAAQSTYSLYESKLLSYAESYSNYLLNGVNINQIILNRESFGGDNNINLNTWLDTVNSPLDNDFDSNLMRNLFNQNDDGTYGNFGTFIWGNEDSIEKQLTGKENKYDANNDNWFESGGWKGIDLSVSFFFFGDLVNNTIKKFVRYQRDTLQNKKFNNMKVILPNLKIKSRTIKQGSTVYTMESSSPKYFQLNAAYMPVPMDLWLEWSQQFLKNRTYYHLGDLLNDFKILLNNSINYKNSQIIESNPLLKSLSNRQSGYYNYSTFYQTTFLVDKADASSFLYTQNKTLSSCNSNYQMLGCPSFDSSKIKKPTYNDANYSDYYIFGYTFDTLNIEDSNDIYPQEDDNKSEQKDSYITSAGNIDKDMSLGIVHFFIGNQMGLAKSFKFNAGTTPYAVESQIESNSNSFMVGIKNVAINDVEIRVVGGNFFKPLDIIYVHPHHTFGDPFDTKVTISNILFIGGYYQIIKVNSTFSGKGIYETTLTAKFLYAAQQAKKLNCDIKLEDFEDIDKDMLEQLKETVKKNKQFFRESIALKKL